MAPKTGPKKWSKYGCDKWTLTVLNRLARNTKIVFSPQRGGFSWALCLHDYFRDSIVCVTGAALEKPVRPSKRLKRGRRSA